MPDARSATRALALGLCCLSAAVLAACDGAADPRVGPAQKETLPVRIAGERFQVELALDPETRRRGLGGRRSIAPDGGMLFAFPAPRVLAFVMRDCFVPIDIAFLDDAGRVVAIHHMEVEPPRREGESAAAYEARLPVYPSGRHARFALETAGGRLADLGLLPGQRIRFDHAAIAARAR